MNLNERQKDIEVCHRMAAVKTKKKVNVKQDMIVNS